MAAAAPGQVRRAKRVGHIFTGCWKLSHTFGGLCTVIRVLRNFSPSTGGCLVICDSA